MSKLERGIITFINAVFLANKDYPYEDYHEDTTLGTYQRYSVGDNNKLGKGTQHKLFVAKSTLILCTEDVYIKFNNANNVVNTLLADTFYEFDHNIYAIYYADVDVAGTIYIWVEGVHPQEGRSPE